MGRMYAAPTFDFPGGGDWFRQCLCLQCSPEFERMEPDPVVIPDRMKCRKTRAGLSYEKERQHRVSSNTEEISAAGT